MPQIYFFGGMNMQRKFIRVLKIIPGEHPEETKIKTSLSDLQQCVDGYIEFVELEEGCVLMCNEEGKIKGLEPNRILGDDIVIGNIFIFRIDDDGDADSLTDDDVKKYMTLFYEPIRR